MPKRNITLEYTGIEFTNRNGDKAKADFRHLDAKEAFLAAQEGNGAEADNGKPVRVYRVSRLGKSLIGRFFGSSKQEDAEEFVEQCNEVYNVRGFYHAEIQ